MLGYTCFAISVITETECVYWAVRTESLNVIRVSLVLQGIDCCKYDILHLLCPQFVMQNSPTLRCYSVPDGPEQQAPSLAVSNERSASRRRRFEQHQK